MTRLPLHALGLATTIAALLAASPATAQAQSLDALGRPTAPILSSISGIAAQSWVPASISESLTKLVSFYRGEGEPGVPLPSNGPAIAQFAYPTVMANCIGGTQSSVGTATAIPGPASLPLPGVPAHQAAFIFTALGTGKVSAHQIQPLSVSWVNVSNGRTGQTPLSFTGVNPDGPATVVGLADTGPGTVLALLQGGVTTDHEGGSSNCAVMPIAGSFSVA